MDNRGKYDQRYEQRYNKKYEQRKRGKKKGKPILQILFGGALLVNALLLLQVEGRLDEMDRELGRVRAALLEEAVTVRDYSEPLAAEGDAPEIDFVSLCGLDKVEAPRVRKKQEIVDCLKELGEDNSLIREIYQNRQSYPDKMLEALANNPEMASFVSGYLSAENKPQGGLTEQEKEQDYPLFLQWDPRWGYVDYGDGSNVGLAGCGPTCLSMALYYLTGDESLTPDEIADYSMENGYYMYGTGTAWALLEDVPPLHGISAGKLTIDEMAMETALDQGSILIASMGSGDFTVNGHFIVIYGYDKEGFMVNDPNCVARSRQHWSFDRLESQIKCLWVFS